MPHESEEELNSEFSGRLDRARSGSDTDVAELLDLFRPFLKRLAHRKIAPDVRPKEGSSDVVQKTLIEGQRDFKGFADNHPAAVRTWLRRILVNNLHDVHRRYLATGKRDASRERSLSDLEAQESLLRLATSQSESPSQTLSRNEQAALVQATILALKPEYQEAVILRYQEELTFAEIGELLEKSPGAAEQLVKRAVYKFGVLFQARRSDDGC